MTYSLKTWVGYNPPKKKQPTRVFFIGILKHGFRTHPQKDSMMVGHPYVNSLGYSALSNPRYSMMVIHSPYRFGSSTQIYSQPHLLSDKVTWFFSEFSSGWKWWQKNLFTPYVSLECGAV